MAVAPVRKRIVPAAARPSAALVVMGSARKNGAKTPARVPKIAQNSTRDRRISPFGNAVRLALSPQRGRRLFPHHFGANIVMQRSPLVYCAAKFTGFICESVAGVLASAAIDDSS